MRRVRPVIAAPEATLTQMKAQLEELKNQP